MKLKNLPVYPFTLDLIYPGLFATHPEPRATEGRSLEGSGGPLGALTQERAGDFLKDGAEVPIRKAPILSHTCFPPLPDQATAAETSPPCLAGAALSAAMKPQYRTARVKQKHTKCLSVGTPKDNCLSRKRLPKKTNPIPFMRQ